MYTNIYCNNKGSYLSYSINIYSHCPFTDYITMLHQLQGFDE